MAKSPAKARPSARDSDTESVSSRFRPPTLLFILIQGEMSGSSVAAVLPPKILGNIFKVKGVKGWSSVDGQLSGNLLSLEERARAEVGAQEDYGHQMLWQLCGGPLATAS
jgi:hypothetical protein